MSAAWRARRSGGQPFRLRASRFGGQVGRRLARLLMPARWTLSKCLVILNNSCFQIVRSLEFCETRSTRGFFRKRALERREAPLRRANAHEDPCAGREIASFVSLTRVSNRVASIQEAKVAAVPFLCQ